MVGLIFVLCAVWKYDVRPTDQCCVCVSQVANERQVGGSTSWMPSVVLEGRVTRSVGSLSGENGIDARFIELYVHDAMYGHSAEDAQQPSVIATHRGHKLVLPASASVPERRRVAQLFEQIFAYVSSTNEFVAACVCAAEEMQNMDEADIRHTVLLIAGKRTREQIAQEQVGGRSPFAVHAGQHGRLRGMPEMCILCPRVVAENEQSAVVVNLRQGGGLQRVPLESRAFDALYNVLLHPTGYVGWEDNMPVRTEGAAFRSLPVSARTSSGNEPRGSSALNPANKVSMCQYYAYRFHWRRGSMRTDNCMFMTNRLFQEFACVAFWRIETARLTIHRLQQRDAREASVDELQDYARQMRTNGDAEAIGRISYIPASFVGGPTDMYARYQDAMASVLHHGPPSLFITMTANPKWPEVAASLAYGQSRSDRYDIIARVFHAKLDELLNDLKSGMLGQQIACVYVIEFQKRGLPHAHIVVILAGNDRPVTGQQVDELSSAEIPPLPPADDTSEMANVQRKLRALVLEHMIHNDCSGPEGRKCPCYDDRKACCGAGFPFAHADATTMGDERAKVGLRRRRGQQWSADVNGRTVTNKWVVPYNAALLLKYQCHLNVEVVTATHAIKYLFKYLFKGADNASAAIHAVSTELGDMIGRYQDRRYLGSSEAFWRIFKFKIHDLTDTVERMAVETPEDRYAFRLPTSVRFFAYDFPMCRCVVRRMKHYRKGNELQAAAAAGELKKKHVEAFVEYCCDDARLTDASTAWRTATVTMFPYHHTFKDGEWRVRRNHTPALARMYAVHPNKGDTFYLRMLLCTLTGADVRQLHEQLHGREECSVCMTNMADMQMRCCNGRQVMCSACINVVRPRRNDEGDVLHGGQKPCPFCNAIPLDAVRRPLPSPTVHSLKGNQATFQDKCDELGLLQNDGEWARAMTDAAQTAMPGELRSLFLHIVCHCMPKEPAALFERFYKELGDDFRRELEQLNMASDQNTRTCTLFDLREALDANASENEKQALRRLPDLTADERALIERLGRTASEPLAYVYEYDQSTEWLRFEEKMAQCRTIEAQRTLIEAVIEVVESPEHQLTTFLDAPGGCGKTYCLNCLLSYFRSQGLVVLAIASTGIAALQLIGGKTVHTAFKVPIDVTGSRTGQFSLKIDAKSALGKLITSRLDLIVWDEVPMTHIDIFESVDHTMRIMREDDRPFGGVNVLLAGDFRQTLPVVRGADRGKQVAASILHSPSFRPFAPTHLITNVRVELCKLHDPERAGLLDMWSRTLLAIGDGKYLVENNDDQACKGLSNLPDIVNTSPIASTDDIDRMIRESIGDIGALSQLSTDDLIETNALQASILCPHHESVNYINDRCLASWTGDAVVKRSMDYYDNPDDARVITLEQLNASTPTGSPPARLELKVGMPLIMLRNMSEGLMNGTRMILVEIRHHILKCVVLNGRNSGQTVYLPRYTFKHEGPDQPLVWTRRQFPVKPCWAMTINKSQSQTFNCVAVCLVHIATNSSGTITVNKADCFAHGQLYVALSRCGDPDKVCVYTTRDNHQQAVTVNIVYPEALLIPPAHLFATRATSDVPWTDICGDDLAEPDLRTHLLQYDNFDVPWHGYVYDDLYGQCWNGSIGNPLDIVNNLTDLECEQWFNYDILPEEYAQCAECTE